MNLFCAARERLTPVSLFAADYGAHYNAQQDPSNLASLPLHIAGPPHKQHTSFNAAQRTGSPNVFIVRHGDHARMCTFVRARTLPCTHGSPRNHASGTPRHCMGIYLASLLSITSPGDPVQATSHRHLPALWQAAQRARGGMGTQLIPRVKDGIQAVP